MTVRTLDKANWRPFFDHLSRMLEGCQAEIEVTSLAGVEHVQATWLPLLGVTYDSKDDLLEVAMENLDHLIRAPQHIRVEDDGGVLVSIEIVDAAGGRQIVKLKEPLLLAPPRS